MDHNITLGGQWWDASTSRWTSCSTKKSLLTQFGLFAEDTWSLNDSLALTLGLRL